MTMDTIQIRMNHGLIKRIDNIIKTGVYDNRADVIRDAVRRFIWEKEAGSIKWNGKDSVEQIRKIRKKLSQEKFNLDELNEFGK